MDLSYFIVFSDIGSKQEIWVRSNKKVQKPVAFFWVFIYYIRSLHKGGDGFV